MYRESGVEISKQIAGLLMAAILSDTLMFRSPTCTAVDRSAAEDLSSICGVEIEEFSIDMFSAGSDMSSRTPKEIFNQDKKKFQVGDISFMVAQINSMNAIELEEVKEKLEPYLNETFDSLGVDMCFVMLTNIVKENTELLCFGERAKDVAKSAFQLPDGMEEILLKGLVSRKKQLIPSLVTVLQK
jgi:manganese-dependent inorganic pyrophosphatase